MRFEKLGNIVNIKKGKKPNFTENPNSDSVRVLQIDDLRNDNNLKFTDDRSGVLACKEDVLLVWDGANAGTVGYGKEGYIGSTIALLSKKEPEKYSTTFIGLFLQSKFNHLRSKTTGATIPHIDGNVLRDMGIPILPYQTQLHIANILTKAESLIAQRKESIRLLDEYLKSVFLEMFGEGNNTKFPLQKLDSVSDKITDGEHGTVNRTETGRMYLMARNINTSNQLDFSEVSFISEEDHQKIYNRCNPEKGDLLMVCVGATIGKVTLVPEMEEFSLARSVALIKSKKNLLAPQYLLWFFNSEFGKRQVKSSRNEAAQAGLYTGKLKQILIPIPPIELQTKFSKIVEKTEALKTQYQQSLQELENLYSSLSQKAFKGELSLK